MGHVLKVIAMLENITVLYSIRVSIIISILNRTHTMELIAVV